MRKSIFRKVIRASLLAIPLLSAAAFAQNTRPYAGVLPPKQTILPPKAPMSAALSLPNSVDLRQWAVPSGYQQYGSCAAWAVAHGLMGWYANYWNMPQTDFAPMYMYSQTDAYYMYPAYRSYYGCMEPDCGSILQDDLELAYTQGVDTAAHYTGASDLQHRPNAAERANAANYKFGNETANSATALFTSASNGGGSDGAVAIQTALSNTQPVVISMRLRPGFWNVTALNDLYTDTTGQYMGSHAVLALGYDRDGLLIQNSWGTGWGNRGFGRLSWAVVQQDVTQAWVVNQAFHPNSPFTYDVTTDAGTGGMITPFGTFAVISGKAMPFTISSNSGYTTSSVNGCGGTWDGSNYYTTGPVTTNCAVAATFMQQSQTYTITASVNGTGGTISPASVQVNSGTAYTFTLTPNANYHVSSVGGTCGGALNGNTFTTNSITSNCTVIANFDYTFYTITASVNGTNGMISPSGIFPMMPSGKTMTFMLTPNANYRISSVDGTCGGSLNLNGSYYYYTTNTITSNCTVVANFIPITYYTVTATAGTGGTIDPSGSLSTASGATRDFTVIPDSGYKIDSVSGCGGTPISDRGPSYSSPTRIYTTGTVTGNCTVSATFYRGYTVTASVDNDGGGTITPSGNLSTPAGTTLTFTATPDAYHKLIFINGTCGGRGGTPDNPTLTTTIFYNCTVVAHFAPK